MQSSAPNTKTRPLGSALQSRIDWCHFMPEPLPLPMQPLVEQLAGAGGDFFGVDFDLGDTGFDGGTGDGHGDGGWHAQVERVGDDEVGVELAYLTH